ncbi:MAG TPA: hypothetical protein ENN65_07215, partial [Candidatus Hydrogenedentes bacterium]|nr:hypothetical protein [Candidatus Hydrogenedentota bacterium]
MNPKIRALIWEQFRVAGTLTLWCLAFSCVMILSANTSSRLLLANDFSTICSVFLAGLALLLLFRQNVAGQLDVQYEPRLSRLPVGAAALTFIPMGIRLLSITFAFAGLN